MGWEEWERRRKKREGEDEENVEKTRGEEQEDEKDDALWRRRVTRKSGEEEGDVYLISPPRHRNKVDRTFCLKKASAIMEDCAYKQGMARHSKTEIMKMGLDDLQALSELRRKTLIFVLYNQYSLTNAVNFKSKSYQLV